MDPRNQSPFNALPPVVAGLAFVIVAIELGFMLGDLGLVGGRGAVGWRLNAIRDWAVAEPVWDWMIENATFPPEHLARFFTYQLIHGGFVHAAFVAVFVLALGNVTSPFFPAWRQLVIFFGAGLAGALAFLILFEARQQLFGGYAGAYGLIGAFTYVSRLGLTRVPPDRAFLLIGLLLAIQPVFGLAAGAGLSWLPDWVAEAVGAAAGYGLAVLMFPGGIDRLRTRMRQR